MKGYAGRVLEVDLGTREVTTSTPTEEFARKFLGGNGFAAKLIHDLVPPDADPLSAENVAVFALGPMTATPVWGTGRGQLAAVSPQTGFFADSNFGGHFASALKRAGVDMVVVKGKADRPTYLSITDEHVELVDAAEIWGRATSAAHEWLESRHGARVESALIGPAGENEVVYACVICSGVRLSAAGRGGLGAVLGSKNFKGIAVTGTQAPEVADREQLKQQLKRVLPVLKEKGKVLTELGTPFLVNMINGKGMLGTRNNQRETWQEAGSISGERIADEFKKKNTACSGCPIACGKLVSVPHGEFADKLVKMPEYETLYAMGSMLENSDIVSIFNGNAVCDELGLDTISFGVTLAFAAECIEKGLLKVDAQDMGLCFGPGVPIAEIAHRTAMREGSLGELLALGSERLAGRIGGDAPSLLHSHAGMEFPGHSPRGFHHMGLAYATSTRGGSHHDARPKYAGPETEPGFTGQPAYCIKSQNNTAVGDSLVICRFVQERIMGTEVNVDYLPFIRSVTGWDMTADELEQIGERVYNLERVINVKRGASRAGDILPPRVMNEPIPDGPAQGRCVPQQELDKMLDEYYRLRGWSPDGVPSQEKLAELGLE